MAYKQTLSLDILHEIIQYYFADTPSRHTSSLADDATRLKLVCKDWNRIVSKILQNPIKTVPPISELPVELHHKIFSYVLAHDPNDQWVADRECTELMLVCRSWRDIIMDWSARWCNVQLKNPNAVAHALNRTRATERSGGLPVPLNITGNLYRGVAGYMRMVRHIRKHTDHIRRVDIKVSRKALRQWVVANPVNPDFPTPILEELQLKKVADNLDVVPDANEHTLLSIFRSQRLRELSVHKFTYRAARALFLPTVEKLSLLVPKESGTSTLQFQQDLLTMPNVRRLTVDLSLSPSANMVDVQLDRLEYLDLTIKKAKDASFLRTVTAHRLRDARIIVEAPDKDIPSILRSLAGVFNVVAVQRHLRCAVFRARNAHGLYVSLTEEEMSTTKGIRLYLKNATLDEHLFRLLTMYMALCLEKVQRLYIEPDLCVPLVRNAATVKMNAEGLLLTIEAMQELRLLQISMKLTRIDNLEDGSAVPCPRLETVVVEDVGVDEALFLSFLIAPNLQDVDLDITAPGGDIHNVVESIAPLLDHVAKNCQGYDANICAQSGQSLELTFTGLETETDAVRLEFLGKDIQNRALTAIARELGSSLQVVREFTVANGEGYERNSWATWYGLFVQMDAVRTLCIEGDASKVFDSGLAFRPGGQQGYRPVFPQMYSLTLENVWFRPRKKKNGPRPKKTFINDLIRSFQHRQQAKSLKHLTIVKGTNIRLADINKLQTFTRYLSSDRAVRK